MHDPHQNHLLDALPCRFRAGRAASRTGTDALGEVSMSRGPAAPCLFPHDVHRFVALCHGERRVGGNRRRGQRRHPRHIVVHGRRNDAEPRRRAKRGTGYRLKAQLLKEEFDRFGPMMHLLLRYTQALITQMAQTAVCNRHHSVDQQLCRWLLLSLDRLASNELSMTQELIANMLGVRREGVTEAAGKLQDAGLIRYRRGRITVLDRRAWRRGGASATRWSRRSSTAAAVRQRVDRYRS